MIKKFIEPIMGVAASLGFNSPNLAPPTMKVGNILNIDLLQVSIDIMPFIINCIAVGFLGGLGGFLFTLIRKGITRLALKIPFINKNHSSNNSGNAQDTSS